MANDSRFNVTFGEARFEEPLVIKVKRPFDVFQNKYNFSFSIELVINGTYHWASLSCSKISSSDYYTTYIWTPTKTIFEKFDNFSNYFASADHVDVTFRLDVSDDTGTVTNTYPLTIYVPNRMRPKVSATFEYDSSPMTKLNEWGICVKNQTVVLFTVNAEAQYGADLDQLNVKLGDKGSGLGFNPPSSPFVWKDGFMLGEDENEIKVVATDSRGFSTEIASDILVYDYAPPVIRDVIVYRCDANGVPDAKGTHLRVQCEADCTSLGGRNTITSVTARYGAGALGNAIALANGVEQVIATGLDPNTTYTVELTVQDDVGETATETIVGDKPRTAMHLKDGGKGFAIGKRSTEDGFHCGWDATFDKNVAILGGLTIGGKTLVDILYPVGSIYLTATGAHPASLFGGTWERIKDTFLLGAGDVYAAGDTGGAAEVELIATQIPEHAHEIYGETDEVGPRHSHDIDTVVTYTEGSSRYAIKSVCYDSSSQVEEKTMSTEIEKDLVYHTHIVNAYSLPVGRSESHNNMPPYCVVNIWKRTA